MTPWRPALLTTIGFYSRLPVPASHDAPLARSVWILPVAAVAIAWPAAAVGGVALALGLSPLLAGLLATLSLSIVTGALHEDGFADCADGFWGGSGVSRRLEIMRDSRIGTYGVTALIGAVGLKAVILADIFAAVGWRGMPVFLAAAVAARAVALFPWVALPNARKEGLAASAGTLHAPDFRKALLLAILVTAVLTAWVSPVGFVAAAAASAAAAKLVASVADAKIGGHTGDVIGAAVILCDLSYLLAFLIFLP